MQHAEGKLAARERIELFLNEGSSTEFGEPTRDPAHDPGIEAPRIAVARGSATPAEVAIVVAVLFAAGSTPEPASTAAAATATPAPPWAWRDRARAWQALPWTACLARLCPAALTVTQEKMNTLVNFETSQQAGTETERL